METGNRQIEIYFGDADIIEFMISDDPALNKIEKLLLEGAINDPIGFREWHKDFKSYVEQKIIEIVEKARNKRNKNII